MLSRAVRSRAGTDSAGYLAAATAASMFAWLGPLSRWAYEAGMEPFGFVAWRSGLGALAVAVAALAIRRAAAAAVPERQWAMLGVASLMALLLNLAMFAAFERTTVALVLIGFYTYPAMVASVAMLLGRERPTPTVIGALALATAGMLVVVLGGLQTAGGLGFDALGFGLALAAAASQTVFVTMARQGYSAIRAERATAVVLAVTTVGALLLAAGGLAPSISLPLQQPGLLPLVVLAGVAGAAVPTLLFLAAIRRVGGTRAGVLMLLEPVIAVALAAVLLGESLRPVQLIGALAVLAAAGLLQLGTGGPTEVEAHPG